MDGFFHAQLAYEAYCAALFPLRLTPPPFAALPQRQQDAWKKAAEAVLAPPELPPVA